MEAHVMKLENNCVIVDEEYFNEIKKQSEFNQERINEIAEEKFLKYVKESGIKLSYEVNGTPYIFHHDLLSELNYEERGYPESVSEKVKHVIADDITEALNDKFKGLKDDAQNYNTDVYSISAPTQSIAQKWLRETKNLHIEIYRSAVGYGYAIVKADNGTWQEDDDSRGTNDGGLWDTYEEALEAGIIKALSLL